MTLLQTIGEEPQEDDKLNSEHFEMENKLDLKSNGKSKNRLKFNYEKLMNNRHDRIQAFLLLIIFVLGLILFIIGIKVLIYAIQPEDDICETSSCLFSSARFSQNINWTINPCENFYEYACGNWINDHKINEYQIEYSIKQQITDQIYFDLRHYLDKILPTVPPDDPYFKVKQFYDSCMNLEEIDLISINSISHEIMSAGGWNILKNWHSASWKYDLAFERLHSHYGVNPFFKIDIGADDLDPQLPFIIKVYPAGITLPKNYYFDPQYKSVVEAYKEFMSETVKIFRISQLDSSQFAENTFSYEKRIAEITPDQSEYLNRSNMFKRRYSIRELKTLAPSIKWLNLFQRYFLKAKLNENTRILLAFEPYFRNISNIISTTDKKALNDYLIWNLLYNYAPYLSKEFRIIHYNFHQGLYKLPSVNLINDEDRWKFCLKTTAKYLGHALSSLFVSNNIKTIYNKTTELKTNIVDSIQRTILDHTNMFIWANDEYESQKLINMKVKQMQTFISYPQFYTNQKLSIYYNEYPTKVSFLQNIIEAIHHQHSKLESLLNEKNSDYAWPLVGQDVDIFYDYTSNKLFIPAGMLNIPYYDIQAPRVAHFGAIGFQIASKMLNAFDLIGLQYNLPDGRLSNNRKFVDNGDLNRNLNCIQKRIESISNKLSNTISQTYIDFGALEIAWMAYKSFEANNKEPLLPSLRSNNDQLFFLSFAQTFCNNIKPKTLEMLYETSHQLHDSIRVNLLLSQNKQFLEVFQCPKPVDDFCHLWN